MKLSCRSHLRGSAAVELLVGLPVLLILALGGLQAGQWFQARLALRLAAEEAAAFGASGNAQIAAIDRGFSRAMVPYLYGAADQGEFALGLVKAQANTALGRAAGWIKINQLSPTIASFEDWAAPAIDSATGQTINGVFEIPNDNLGFYKTTLRPKSGENGLRDDQPIGSASGQTLLDANQLKLEITYGMPLTLPLLGKLTAQFLLAANNCSTQSKQTIALLTIQNQVQDSVANPSVCEYLTMQPPRLPIKVQSIAAMQSPARRTELTVQKTQTASATQTTLGPGQVDAYVSLRPIGQVNPAGSAIGVAVEERTPGYLHIGTPTGTQINAPTDGGVCEAIE